MANNNYLERIVQILIEVPAITKQELEKYLFSKLDEVIKGVPEKEWDSVYWSVIDVSGISKLFTNIGEATRFINMLGFNFNMVKDKVSRIDFMAITALQIVELTVYE